MPVLGFEVEVYFAGVRFGVYRVQAFWPWL